jgi:hypothetical protein
MEAGTGTVDTVEVGCEAFFGAEGEPSSLRRFLVGSDETPQVMEAAEVEAELNDPLAVELFRQGQFPATTEELLAALDARVGADHPLAVKSQRSFVVGEGSQIAKDPSRSFDRRLRFVVTRGQGPDGPDILISAFQAASQSVEVMAWDERNGGFNYYRTVGGSGGWVWAGNSRHAWEPDTRSSGPFESHPTGNLLFKEFKLPWVHWHSPLATMDQLDFAAGDTRATHPWFGDKDGAYVLEDSVAKPAIHRWNGRRLAQVADAGTIADPAQVMERLLGSPNPRRFTVNLISSNDRHAELESAERVSLPSTFFVDVDGLSEVLGLAAPAPEGFSVAASAYREALAEFGVAVRNHDQSRPLEAGEEAFERPGDTNFLFVVPERAFEDVDFLRQLVKPEPATGERDLGLVSDRLAACLLMVDFPNPVFSERRAGLLHHVEAAFPGPVPAEEWGRFSETLGDAIAAAAGGGEGGPAEAEFAELWSAGDGWKEAANARLEPYYEALAARLATPDGVKDVFRLAEARRNRVRRMPIDETPLLFAQSNLDPADLAGLAMTPGGAVEQRDPQP